VADGVSSEAVFGARLIVRKGWISALLLCDLREFPPPLSNRSAERTVLESCSGLGALLFRAYSAAVVPFPSCDDQGVRRSDQVHWAMPWRAFFHRDGCKIGCLARPAAPGRAPRGTALPACQTGSKNAGLREPCVPSWAPAPTKKLALFSPPRPPNPSLWPSAGFVSHSPWIGPDVQYWGGAACPHGRFQHPAAITNAARPLFACPRRLFFLAEAWPSCGDKAGGPGPHRLKWLFRPSRVDLYRLIKNPPSLEPRQGFGAWSPNKGPIKKKKKNPDPGVA